MSRARAARGAALATGVAVAVIFAPGAANGAPIPADPLWYFDALHVQAAHDAGFTGAGITIAVFDTQINTAIPTLADADIEASSEYCHDTNGNLMPAITEDAAANHGTNVVSYIVGSGAGYPGQVGVKGVAPDATILYYVVGIPKSIETSEEQCRDADGDEIEDRFTTSVYEAVDAGADILSFSQGFHEASMYTAIAYAVSKGVVVVGGLPNALEADLIEDAIRFDHANGVISVQAMDPTGAIESTDGKPHLNSATDVVAPGVGMLIQGDPFTDSWTDQATNSGTSIATPIVAGFLAMVKQKYPDATANQLIQTLIHNTGTVDHELLYDATETVGYGFASLTHMLSVDPTQYEDVNPLFEDGFNPTAEMVANAITLEQYRAGLDGAPTESPADGDPPSSFLPAVLLGLGGLIVVGTIVLIVVLASRGASRRKDSNR